MGDPSLGAGLAALAFWGFVAVCVVAGIWEGIRKREARHETLRRLIESGQTVDRAVLDRVMGDSRLDKQLTAYGWVTLAVAPGATLKLDPPVTVKSGLPAGFKATVPVQAAVPWLEMVASRVAEPPTSTSPKARDVGSTPIPQAPAVGALGAQLAGAPETARVTGWSPGADAVTAQGTGFGLLTRRLQVPPLPTRGDPRV